jgi:hypothetical protein
MGRAPTEIAAALGISFPEFEMRRAGRGDDSEFRRRYYRGRQKAKDENMTELDRLLRRTDIEILRSMIDALDRLNATALVARRSTE